MAVSGTGGVNLCREVYLQSFDSDWFSADTLIGDCYVWNTTQAVGRLQTAKPHCWL